MRLSGNRFQVQTLELSPARPIDGRYPVSPVTGGAFVRAPLLLLKWGQREEMGKSGARFPVELGEVFHGTYRGR